VDDGALGVTATGGTVGGDPRPGPTAFVLGGGGLLGASEIGMLRALFEAGRRPDLVIGTSVGALNGALVAADPTPGCLDRLVALWQSMSTNEVFSVGLGRLRDVARHRTHLHPITPLRDLIDRELGHARIEDLAVPFQCCAASIERAAETWFTSGPVSAAVTASCAVPGLFPPVRIGDEHFLDGGIVNSIPVGRAIELGATTVYVLHVGRISQPLTAPTRPWEVAMVAFEIARRHRFARDMAEVPDGVTVHVLPAGDVVAPTANLRYRDTKRVGVRVEQAYRAAAAYLAGLDGEVGSTLLPPVPPSRRRGKASAWRERRSSLRAVGAEAAEGAVVGSTAADVPAAEEAGGGTHGTAVRGGHGAKATSRATDADAEGAATGGHDPDAAGGHDPGAAPRATTDAPAATEAGSGTHSRAAVGGHDAGATAAPGRPGSAGRPGRATRDG
jgi:NTE family protein